MLDLARDDDFLSHLLVEKLGTGHIPLLVHKMDPSRRLPKTNPLDLMTIIRRVRLSFPPHVPSPSFIAPIHALFSPLIARLCKGFLCHHHSRCCRPPPRVRLFASFSLPPPFPWSPCTYAKFSLPSVRYFTKGFTEREVNSFATFVTAPPPPPSLLILTYPFLPQTQPCFPLHGTLSPNRLH
jgi:hypothetical protein